MCARGRRHRSGARLIASMVLLRWSLRKGEGRGGLEKVRPGVGGRREGQQVVEAVGRDISKGVFILSDNAGRDSDREDVQG